MKMKMTIETHEIKALIRASLAAQGIEARDEDIVFSKNKAVVDVDASLPLAPAANPASPPATAAQMAAFVEEINGGPPKLAVVADNVPADFSTILQASTRLTNGKPAPFPEPERTLMKGESYDFPHGDK